LLGEDLARRYRVHQDLDEKGLEAGMVGAEHVVDEREHVALELQQGSPRLLRALRALRALRRAPTPPEQALLEQQPRLARRVHVERGHDESALRQPRRLLAHARRQLVQLEAVEQAVAAAARAQVAQEQEVVGEQRVLARRRGPVGAATWREQLQGQVHFDALPTYF